ncbi:hypothetical protein SAY86_012567 [Trapa natans]|uniref:Uncharacterized protein n=1 Tax=Trapa natans TaxID=22666 RepID=A0AAN7MCW8_TRANT|nr:hypothetical protein SAY86_012567 [Trapa natans]
MVIGETHKMMIPSKTKLISQASDQIREKIKANGRMISDTRRREQFRELGRPEFREMMLEAMEEA